MNDLISFIQKHIEPLMFGYLNARAVSGTDDLVVFGLLNLHGAGPEVDWMFSRRENIEPGFLAELQKSSGGARPFASCTPNYDAAPGRKMLWVCLLEDPHDPTNVVTTRIKIYREGAQLHYAGTA